MRLERVKVREGERRERVMCERERRKRGIERAREGNSAPVQCTALMNDLVKE